jgi:DNA modification methylase
VRTVGGRFRLFANHARVLQALEDEAMTTLPLVLWRKPTNAPTKFMGSGMLPAGAYVTLEHEYIIIARKGGPRRPTDTTERARRRGSAIFWEERNSWYSDLWELRGTGQGGTGFGRTRTAAYPLEIPFRLAAMYSWEGDTILDPFSGTGTTALAAAALGRNSISLEITEGAHEGAVRRFGDEKTIAALVERQQERLARHLRFASERASVSHHNDLLGTPVVTRQEVDLRLLQLATVEREADLAEEVVFRAGHAEVRSAPLDPNGDGESEGIVRRD